MLGYCVYIKSNVQFISPRHSWLPREMTSEEREQKFHTDDVSLPRFGQCFCLVERNFQPIRSTAQTWVVTSHQCGNTTLFLQTSFRRETVGDVAKCRLFLQAKT